MKSLLQFSEAPLQNVKVLDVEQVLQDPKWYGGSKKANQRTSIFESTACIVAMKGKAFKEAGLKDVMKDSEFDPIAKEFYTRFLNERKEFNGSDPGAIQALIKWIVNIGWPTAELRPVKAFIQNSINDYYNAVPKSFEVPTAVKTNTTDIVLIVNGSKGDLFKLLGDLTALDIANSKAKTLPSAKRIKTTKDGKCTILDSDGKESISFYQVSLKKGFGEAQGGKAAEWLNLNYISGMEDIKKIDPKTGKPGQQIRAIARPSKADPLAKERGYADEYETVGDIMLQEGFLDFLRGKITSAIEDVKNFVKWSVSSVSKVTSAIIPKIERFAQSVIKGDKGIKAIENILSKVPGGLTEEYFNEVSSTNVRLSQSMMDDFQVVDKEFLRKRKINKVHRNNVKLYTKLNKKYKFKGRPMDPIVMLQGIDAGIISVKSTRKEIQSLLKKKPNKKGVWPEVTREQVNLIFKLGSNFSANISIHGILRGIESVLKQKVYGTLSAALFSLAADLEAEVKFGNTALPLIIVYGGKNGKLEVLGKRENFQKKRVGELIKTEKGKKYNDFPWLVLSVQKSGGIEKYNTVGFKLVSTFKENKDGEPVPYFMPYSVRTNSGSGFTCTIEAGTPIEKWRGRN